jgi:hypothetical protein
MIVVSKAPLSTIINNSDAIGRVAKWGIELSAFDINYQARTAIKSQVLADFFADWTEALEGTLVPEPEPWVMHFDGSKQHQGSGGWSYPEVINRRITAVRSVDSLRSYKQDGRI